MTESLTRLLLRHSESGEPAIVWGRLAKPFLGREFDRLLSRGVLVEEAPADEWDVCSDCRCGCDSRLIQTIGGELIAACPIDHRSDAVLDPEDIRSFRVDTVSMVREIATSSNLRREPALAMPGLWYMGVGPANRSLFLALARGNVLAPGLIATLQRVSGVAPITIVAPALPSANVLRFSEAGIHYVPTTAAFPSAGDRFAFDEDMLMPKASTTARLTLFLRQSKIVIDGRRLELSHQNFQLLRFLAEELATGGGLVSHDAIEKKMWATVVSRTATADAVRNLRKALEKRAGNKGSSTSLIQSLAPWGYRLNLDASEVRLVND